MSVSRVMSRDVRKGMVLAVCLAIGLSSCAGRPGPETLASITDEAFKPVKVETLFAVTTRDRAEPGKNVFTAGKARSVNYASFDVSIPANHKPANIEWPKGSTVDPSRDFAVIDQSVLQREQLLDAVA